MTRDDGPLAELILCPKCGGQKFVNKPPWVAGDQQTWSATSTNGHLCVVCNGQGVVRA